MKNFVKVPNKRVLLTEDDFKTLVSGNIVVQDGIEVALQDIGYHRMREILNEVDRGGDVSTNELREMLSLLAPPRRDNNDNIFF
jgi:hypothetical protein